MTMAARFWRRTHSCFGVGLGVGLGLGCGFGCVMDNPAFDLDEVADAKGDGDPSTASGEDGEAGTSSSDEGDPSTTGDGDPSTSTGDGDPSTTGDGDGDPNTTSGDGDGDADNNPCAEGLEECNGECVDLQFNDANCGSCDLPCPNATLCGQGECVAKRYVFVAKPGAGYLEGIVGANLRCNLDAQQAQLPGSYKAWLSNEIASPAQNFAKNGAYMLPNGVVVAWGWDDLTDGQLIAPINRNASGQAISATPNCGIDYPIWTGTNPDGTLNGPHCGAWILGVIPSEGRVGDAAATGPAWSAIDCTVACENELGIYCMQQ